MRSLARRICLALLVAALLGGAAAAAPPGTKELLPRDPAFIQSPAPYRQIDAPAFWAATLAKPCGVKVAVLDSAPAAIPDLRTVQAGANFAPGTGDTGHGTMVTSVIGGGVDDGVGVAGLTDCAVLPGRIMDPTGYWQTDWLASALTWAANQPGVRVINASLWQTAGQTSDPAVNTAIQNATARGILVVLIAGNGSSNDGQGTSAPSANPLASANPGAIRVAGVDGNGAIHPNSNRGPALADIAAPFNMPVDLPSGGWTLGAGTSFSAPAVAAVAAELFDFNPALTPAQVKSLLMSSGTRSTGLDVVCGCVLNAYAALLAAGYQPSTTPPPPVKVTVIVRKGGTGRGTITSTPPGIRCGTKCHTAVVAGTTLKLAAKASAGSRFVRWSGACRGSRPTCALKVTRSVSAMAVFRRR